LINRSSRRERRLQITSDMDKTFQSLAWEERRLVLRVLPIKVKYSVCDQRSMLRLKAKSDGHGGVVAQDTDENVSDMRREQGYGPGSGVGA
jgi:hypothetical protein